MSQLYIEIVIRASQIVIRGSQIVIRASQICTPLLKSKTVILCGVCGCVRVRARALLTALYQLKCGLNDVMIIQDEIERNERRYCVFRNV